MKKVRSGSNSNFSKMFNRTVDGGEITPKILLLNFIDLQPHANSKLFKIKKLFFCNNRMLCGRVEECNLDYKPVALTLWGLPNIMRKNIFLCKLDFLFYL